ncbi:hypothetical protein AGR6A_Lc50051 [Agrobacterium sp. NCPPB 925]|nr:hypothetical protein AGR6A_Lc50051 [Agrobacterium sp. NCPPB 925]
MSKTHIIMRALCMFFSLEAYILTILIKEVRRRVRCFPVEEETS